MYAAPAQCTRSPAYRIKFDNLQSILIKHVLIGVIKWRMKKKSIGQRIVLTILRSKMRAHKMNWKKIAERKSLQSQIITGKESNSKLKKNIKQKKTHNKRMQVRNETRHGEKETELKQKKDNKKYRIHWTNNAKKVEKGKTETELEND